MRTAFLVVAYAALLAHAEPVDVFRRQAVTTVPVTTTAAPVTTTAAPVTTTAAPVTTTTVAVVATTAAPVVTTTTIAATTAAPVTTVTTLRDATATSALQSLKGASQTVAPQQTDSSGQLVLGQTSGAPDSGNGSALGTPAIIGLSAAGIAAIAAVAAVMVMKRRNDAKRDAMDGNSRFAALTYARDGSRGTRSSGGSSGDGERFMQIGARPSVKALPTLPPPAMLGAGAYGPRSGQEVTGSGGASAAAPAAEMYYGHSVQYPSIYGAENMHAVYGLPPQGMYMYQQQQQQQQHEQQQHEQHQGEYMHSPVYSSHGHYQREQQQQQQQHGMYQQSTPAASATVDEHSHTHYGSQQDENLERTQL